MSCDLYSHRVSEFVFCIPIEECLRVGVVAVKPGYLSENRSCQLLQFCLRPSSILALCIVICGLCFLSSLC